MISPSLKVGVLRGGPSNEYDVSLKTGANVLKHLLTICRPVDIFISKEGLWHVQGQVKSPEKILRQVDVVWNALHGKFGEDGQVQAFLDSHGVKYTGSGRMSSSISMNKFLTKKEALEANVKTPLHLLVRSDDDYFQKAKDSIQTFPFPVVVKPVSGGSSQGVAIVKNVPDLVFHLQNILNDGGSALVEEYIAGKEATCGVIDNFRNSKTYVLPPVEILHKSSFFDYDSKYSGQSKEICPGNFSKVEKDEIERMSSLIHQKLGLSHYSRSDFIVHPKRGVYFLEVNSLPGMTKESLLPKSLEAVGVSMKEFISHILSLALKSD